MPTRRLPARPNLEHLRNQAKDLLKAYRAGDPVALVRFREALPRLSTVSNDHAARPSPSLRDAQRVIAAEHGFASWSLLRTHVERKEFHMIEMTIDRIVANPDSNQRFVLLRTREADRCLPIWIGTAEADSIALKLQGKELPRPMTHDLMDLMISDLGAKVVQVVVSGLRDDTFLARVVLQRNGTTIERDSRPSDAIALAVRCGAPIFADEDVLERAGTDLDPETGEPVFSISRQVDMLPDDARSLLVQAGVEAKRLGRETVEPEDMLLALLRETGHAVSHLGADLETIRSRLEDRSGSGGPVCRAQSFSSPGKDPGARKMQTVEGQHRDAPAELGDVDHRVLHLARAQAALFSQGPVDTAHMLLGLMLGGDGPAWEVLENAGIEIEGGKASLTRML